MRMNKKAMFFEKKYFITVLIFFTIIVLGFLLFRFGFFEYISDKANFGVDAIFFKTNIIMGGESIEYIKITNGLNDQWFEIYLEDLIGVATLPETEFSLDSGQTKNVQIIFKDNLNKAGIYIGQLVIKTPNYVKKIPIILGVEEKSPYYALSQKPIPNYLGLYPGGRFGIDLKVYNLRSNELQDVEINYEIKNLNGEVISSEKEMLAISETLSVSKIIVIPSNTLPGEYVLVTTLNFLDSKSFSTYLFEINNRSSGFDFEKYRDYFIFTVLVVILIVLFFFIRHMRNKNQFSTLNRQQKKEIQKNIEFMNKYKQQLKEVLKEELINQEKTIIQQTQEIKKDKSKKKEQERLKQEEKEKKILELKLKSKIDRQKAEEESFLSRMFEEFRKGKEDMQRDLSNEQKNLLRERKKLDKVTRNKMDKKLAKTQDRITPLFKKDLGRLDKVKTKVFRELKAKHKKQQEIIKQLEKQGKKSEIYEKLGEWERESRQMPEIRRNLSPKQKIVKNRLKTRGKRAKEKFMKKYYSDLKKREFKLD